jgi:2-keto-4-pentenoate hydratase/2-oxohepta-3-ene-1,7-dioic acid hydratase in catechol pathway
MRLARHGTARAEQPLAAGADGVWRDLRPVVADLNPGTLPRVLECVVLDGLPVVAKPGRFGPPLAGIGKVVCVGLTYRSHAAETGARIPEEPIVFLKTPDTVVGPHDEVLVPRRSVKTGYEAGLAVVIGRQTRYLDDEAAAAACVAGYAISNDVSEREFRMVAAGAAPRHVINTGTPAEVAMGLAGQSCLRAGDTVELEIDGLGRQRQTIGQA